MFIELCEGSLNYDPTMAKRYASHLFTLLPILNKEAEDTGENKEAGELIQRLSPAAEDNVYSSNSFQKSSLTLIL